MHQSILINFTLHIYRLAFICQIENILGIRGMGGDTESKFISILSIVEMVKL